MLGGLPPALDRMLPVFDAEGDSLVHELRFADWPGRDEAISARELRLDDDRGRPVYKDIELGLPRGDVLVLHGAVPSGKTALLLTLGGRVTRVKGDLKVLGRVLPQHVHAVRRKVAIVRSRGTPDPVRELEAALDAGAELVLVDDVDLVLRTDARAKLRDLLATSDATFVLTCQDPERVRDLLPARTHLLSLAPQLVEVS